MALRYASGEEIRLGDQVDHCGLRGEVELLADPDAPGAKDDWYVQEYGSCVLIVERIEPKQFGRLVVPQPEKDACLALVGRKEG